MTQPELREVRPYTLTVGRYRFTYKWRSWGCSHQRHGIGAYGQRSPLAAFRDCRRAWRERVSDGQRALYREAMAAWEGKPDSAPSRRDEA